MKRFKHFIAIVLSITATLSLFACGNQANQESVDDFMLRLKDATSYTTLLEHFNESGELQYARYYYLDDNKAMELPLLADYSPDEDNSFYIVKNDNQYDCIYSSGSGFELHSGQESEQSFNSLGRKVESELGYLLKDKYFNYDESTKTYILTTEHIEFLTDFTVTVKIENNKVVITESTDVYKTVLTITKINSTSITLPSVS